MESAWYSEQQESSNEDDEKELQPPKKWVPAPIVPGKPPEAFIEEMLKSPEVNEDDEDDEDDEDQGEAEKPAVESTAEEPDEAEAESETVEASSTQEVEPSTEPSTAEIGETSGPEYDEEPIEIPLRPRRENQEATAPEQVVEEAEPAPDGPPITPVGPGGGFTPPPPPNPPVETVPAKQPEPLPSSAFAPFPNWNIPPTPANTVPRSALTEQLPVLDRGAEQAAEKRGMRRGLVAGFITGYVLKAYLDGRKHARYEKATSRQIGEQEEQIARLERERQQLNERMKARVEEYARRHEQLTHSQPARFEKPEDKLPPVETAEEEPMFDQEGNQIILQPGWHVERSAGGYSVVLDEHNRVVYDAINYGEAYRRDKRREQLRVDTFAATDSGLPPAIGGVAGTVLATPVNEPTANAKYGAVPTQNRVVDVQRRLPEPHNPFIATIASPWLWTAVAILVIVYFVAALS